MTCTYFAHKRPISEHKTEIEGLETDIPSKWTGKKSQGSNTYTRQNRFQNKGHKKRPRRTLYNNPRGDSNKKTINIVNIYAPNIGAPKYMKKILEDFKKDIDSNTLILGDFNTPL